MAFGKILGGGLGWAFGGPLGALLGIAVGELLIDAKARQAQSGRTGIHQSSTSAADFGAALIALSAAVIQTDGQVVKAEIQFVREFFNRQFGIPKTNEYIRLLQQVIKHDVPVRQICDQIRLNMEHPLRLELLRYLFEVSRADGHVHPKEIEMIQRIANYLNISDKDFLSLKNMFYKDTDSSYKILEIEKSATDEEVKKAYRKMALKYHPDKVSGLGPEFEKNAKEKFQKVQEAYDRIKKERGLK